MVCLVLICLYVDDFRITADSRKVCEIIAGRIESTWRSKRQVGGTFYLGMGVDHDHDRGVLCVSQSAYIERMLDKFGMATCAPVDTPAVPNTKLTRPSQEAQQDQESQRFPYREAVGSLLWLARATRPDILYAVCQCAAHCTNFASEHVVAVKRIFRYLRGTSSLPLIMRRPEGPIRSPRIVAYADADFAGEPEGSDFAMRSTTGIVIGLDSVGVITCVSSLQQTISRSTAESEYRAHGDCAQRVLSLRNILDDIGLTQEVASLQLCDNQAAIVMAANSISGAKTRHIKLDHHFIRQVIRDGQIELRYCPTALMAADIQTKALVRETFKKHAKLILDGDCMFI